MEKEVWKAVWIFLGVTIGAGVIGLPYVVEKAGFFTGLVVIFLIAGIIILISLYLGEILLRTRVKHQLTGLAGLYLGKFGKSVMILVNSLSIYGALIAYVLGAGSALKALFSGSEFFYSIAFFVVVSAAIFFTINIFEEIESIINPLKILTLLALSFLLLKFVDFSNLTEFNIANILVPYGVTVFAFTGFSVIPEMSQELKNKLNLKKAIILGGIITAVLYTLFVFTTIGAVDGEIGEVATVSLSLLGRKISIFANLFSLFAMTTAFVGLGFALKENYTLDYKISKWKAWLMVVLIPFLFLIFELGNFILFLEITGAIAIGIIFILILFMHSKAKKFSYREPEYEVRDNWFVKGLLYLLVLVGIVYTVIGFF